MKQGNISESSSSLTVLICTHRLDNWLKDALNSVFENHGIDFEVVLVFDGIEGQDLSEFTNDPRLRCVILEKNLGIGGALCAGMKVITSEFVAKLDNDDLCHPNRLIQQFQYLESHPQTALVSCQMTYINEAGDVTGASRLPSGDDVRLDLLHRNIVAGPASMFRRSYYEQSGGYNPRMKKMEDYDLWLRISKFGPIAVLDTQLYYYRKYSNSLSTTIRPWHSYILTVLKQKSQLARTMKVSTRTRLIAEYGWLWLQWRAYFGHRIELFARNTPNWVKKWVKKIARI